MGLKVANDVQINPVPAIEKVKEQKKLTLDKWQNKGKLFITVNFWISNSAFVGKNI